MTTENKGMSRREFLKTAAGIRTGQKDLVTGYRQLTPQALFQQQVANQIFYDILNQKLSERNLFHACFANKELLPRPDVSARRAHLLRLLVRRQKGKPRGESLPETQKLDTQSIHHLDKW